MSSVYHYAIVRFRPYAETGEFANIGVIAVNLATSEMQFRLAPKRFARIGHFFDTKAHQAYSSAIEELRIELPRAIEFLPRNYVRSSTVQFSGLIGSAESSITFSEPRTIKTDLDLDNLIAKLFDRFVRREFDRDEDIEARLTKDIRKKLHQFGIKHFRTLTVADEIIPIRFPLAYYSSNLAAIKPLAFDHKNPIHIIDYSAYWKKRLIYHLEKGNIQPGNLYLAIEPPSESADDHFHDAFNVALSDLKELPFEVGVNVIKDNLVPEGILHFAERFPARQRVIFH